ncbi:OadG family transporter subunit [Aestuariibacter sp. AA17]|uniref:Probable oxaloacetate decarboxylase gamma chain n=1 Tax=Fluctibacter corallii TaxID=2984329 RepID=A0ABT3A3C4_9ALTE|nr:OadG family transporter subunit [Aestuariibacter sp. AA17]MCV2883163.1 OadG family transporter subunit [Aestuariibacter sp. AA17]
MDSSVHQLLVEAGTLLLVGMSFVFVFLTILIAAVHGITLFCKRFPEPATPHPSSAVPVVSQQNDAGQPSPQVVAAITAAIHQYRQTK